MATLEQLAAKPPPWRLDNDGVRRVGGTRVRLEAVLFAFNQGASAEEILLKYPSLQLPDIYSVTRQCCQVHWQCCQVWGRCELAISNKGTRLLRARLLPSNTLP
jgi:hypothetical protein